LKDKQPPVYDSDMISKIREACRIGRNAVDVGHRVIAPGVTTEEIDK